MLNKVTLIGRVGNDPETRHTADGTTVSTFSLATSETWKDKSGNKKETTEWHTVVAWRKLGEIVGEYVKKGTLLYIEGKLTTRKWEKDGQKHQRTEVVANTIKMLGGGKGNNSSSAGNKPQSQQQGYGDNDFIPEIEDEDVPL